MSKFKCTKHTTSEHFWKLSCRKRVRHCGGKQISKSKCTKNTFFSNHSWTLRNKKGRRWQSAFPSQDVQNTECLNHIENFTPPFPGQAQCLLQPTKGEQHVMVLSQFQLHPPLHFIRSTPPHDTTATTRTTTTTPTLRCVHILLHTTFQSIPPQETTPHSTTFPHTTRHYNTQPCRKYCYSYEYCYDQIEHHGAPKLEPHSPCYILVQRAMHSLRYTTPRPPQWITLHYTTLH